jgi:hypothetical protein
MNKVFNPFKPHIVEFASGKFAVRKFKFPFWRYYDNQTSKLNNKDYWWSDLENNLRHRYEVDTLEMAQILLEMCQLRKTIQSKKILKVYQ